MSTVRASNKARAAGVGAFGLRGFGFSFSTSAARFATLSGSVLDQTNRVITNTTLVLTNAQTRAKYEVHSDSTGRFEFVGLPAGGYELEATRPGFAHFKWELIVSGERVTA